MDVDTARDLAALQGCWVQTSFDVGGAAPADALDVPGTLTTIRGDAFTVHATDGRVLLRGRFELDATATPGAITWIDAIGADRGKRLPASYRLEGDRFTFIAADAGAPRPTVFRIASGLTMRTFERVQPD